LGERLARGTVVAIVVAVGGAALIGWADAGSAVALAGGGALYGNGLALGASLLVSGYLLIGRVVRQRVSWLAYVTPLYTVAAVTVLAVALATGTPLGGYDTRFYLLCLGMAVGPQLLGHGSFNYALQYLPAALVSLLALLEPVGAAALAYVLFGEAPAPLAVAGMLVVLVAVGAVVRIRRGRRPAPPTRVADEPRENASAS
jgi:drug/metabolite transporter (DMT)-like permease